PALRAAGRADRLGLSEHRQVVVPPNARADTGNVGPVDVDRDRGAVADVADPMNVSRRREAADVAGLVGTAPSPDEARAAIVEPEQLLVLRALNDSEHAPRDVIVDRRRLPGPPDEGDDREGAVGLGVDHVAPVAVRVPGPLPGREDRGGRKRAFERPGHAAPGFLPIALHSDGCPYSGNEPPSFGCGRHCSYRPSDGPGLIGSGERHPRNAEARRPFGLRASTATPSQTTRRMST